MRCKNRAPRHADRPERGSCARPGGLRPELRVSRRPAAPREVVVRCPCWAFRVPAPLAAATAGEARPRGWYPSHVCARYSLTAPAPQVEAFLEATAEAALRARYNVAPGQDAAVAIRSDGGARVLVPQRFGLEPGADGARVVNARAETAAGRPLFLDAFRCRRALVPADGFYEWRRRRDRPEPFHVTLREGGLFAMAALWQPHAAHGAHGARGAFAILTGPAPAPLRALHDRVPILVEPAGFDAWLDPRTGVDEARALLRNELAGSLVFRAVDPRVNDPAFDDPACLAPAPQLSLL